MLRRGPLCALLIAAPLLLAADVLGQSARQTPKGRPINDFPVSAAVGQDRSEARSVESASCSSSGTKAPGYWVGDKWVGYAPHADDARRSLLQVSYQETTKEDASKAEVDKSPSTSDSEAKKSTDSEVCCGSCWLWGRAEYLGWWLDGMNVPPVVTTGSLASEGILGESGTRTLFGDTGLNSDARSGGRFTLGLWLDSCHCCGLEATYLAVGKEAETFTASNSGHTVLARPYFDVVADTQASRLIAYPDEVQGSVSVTAETEFEAVSLLLRRPVRRGCWTQLDLLFGYRWAELNDYLLIEETTLSLTGDSSGSLFYLDDLFRTRTEFHGADFGVNWRRQFHPCWSLDLLAKIAIGNIHSMANVRGQTIETPETGDATVAPRGLLALDTNSGTYRRNRFGTLTEFGITLRRQFACGLDATFGYTFMFLSDVLRAGDQIDTGINPSQIPSGALDGAARPAFAFNAGSFWAQGLHVGLDYRF